MADVIGFVPARGGSQRIPRKNLRTVHGVPLVARTIQALHAAGIERVVVSTDDHEIADVASIWGAEIDIRPAKFAGPGVTIDQVVDEWIARVGVQPECPWVAVAQPTSPLLTPVSIANAVQHAIENDCCVFTVTPERHLLWSPSTVPLFDRRENSNMGGEDDASYFRETGGLVVFDGINRQAGDIWPPMPRTMMTVDWAEAIDIDDYNDLTRARAGAQPKRIQLRYVETHDLGHGHRKRCETLAAELAGRHIVTVVDHAKEPLPQSYDVTTFGGKPESVGDVDLVVLDILDTDTTTVKALRGLDSKGGNGTRVASLEDMGPGALYTDATINELYAEREYMNDRTWCGPRWAVLRAEFQGHSYRERKQESMRAVVTFGGTDPHDVTARAVEALVRVPQITSIRVIAPPGRPGWKLDIPKESFLGRAEPLTIETLMHPCMADEFLQADVAVTSAGRTVHEAVACACPTISIPVNEREQAHCVCPGVRYLPGVDDISLGTVRSAQESAQLAHEQVDGLGAQRIAYVIDGLLGGVLW